MGKVALKSKLGTLSSLIIVAFLIVNQIFEVEMAGAAV